VVRANRRVGAGGAGAAGLALAHALLLGHQPRAEQWGTPYSSRWDGTRSVDAIRAARPDADVWYADDALRWHHNRSRAVEAVRQADRVRLAAWRDQHPLDVVRVIAERRLLGE